MSTFKKYMSIIQEVKDLPDLKPIYIGKYIRYPEMIEYLQSKGAIVNKNEEDEKGKLSVNSPLSISYQDYFNFIGSGNISAEEKAKIISIKDFDKMKKMIMKGKSSKEVASEISQAGYILQKGEHEKSFTKIENYLNKILENNLNIMDIFKAKGKSFLSKIPLIKNVAGSKAPELSITYLKDVAKLKYNNQYNSEYDKYINENNDIIKKLNLRKIYINSKTNSSEIQENINSIAKSIENTEKTETKMIAELNGYLSFLKLLKNKKKKNEDRYKKIVDGLFRGNSEEFDSYIPKLIKKIPKQ